MQAPTLPARAELVATARADRTDMMRRPRGYDTLGSTDDSNESTEVEMGAPGAHPPDFERDEAEAEADEYEEEEALLELLGSGALLEEMTELIEETEPAEDSVAASVLALLYAGVSPLEIRDGLLQTRPDGGDGVAADGAEEEDEPAGGEGAGASSAGPAGPSSSQPTGRVSVRLRPRRYERHEQAGDDDGDGVASSAQEEGVEMRPLGWRGGRRRYQRVTEEAEDDEDDEGPMVDADGVFIGENRGRNRRAGAARGGAGAASGGRRQPSDARFRGGGGIYGRLHGRGRSSGSLSASLPLGALRRASKSASAAPALALCVCLLALVTLLTYGSIDFLPPLMIGLTYDSLWRTIGADAAVAPGMYWLGPFRSFYLVPQTVLTYSRGRADTDAGPPVSARAADGLAIKLEVSMQWRYNSSALPHMFALLESAAPADDAPTTFRPGHRLLSNLVTAAIVDEAAKHATHRFFDSKAEIAISMEEAARARLAPLGHFAEVVQLQLQHVATPKDFEAAMLTSAVTRLGITHAKARKRMMMVVFRAQSLVARYDALATLARARGEASTARQRGVGNALVLARAVDAEVSAFGNVSSATRITPRQVLQYAWWERLVGSRQLGGRTRLPLHDILLRD